VKLLLIVLMLLTGCAQKETIQEQPKVYRTTVYRYVSDQCVDQSSALREALKSRDHWKRYAERLEQLPAAKTTNDPNP
jgi:anti-sigma factor ChrR (cupin superfamily)